MKIVNKAEYLRLSLKGNDVRVLDQAVKIIIGKNLELGIICKGPIILPNKTSTISFRTSPHAHKDAWETFGSIVHRRNILVPINKQTKALNIREYITNMLRAIPRVGVTLRIK